MVLHTDPGALRNIRIRLGEKYALGRDFIISTQRDSCETIKFKGQV